MDVIGAPALIGPASGFIPSLQDVDFLMNLTQGCTAFALGYLLLPLWGGLEMGLSLK